jgi:5-formyltetrahydrofolate cyclo-ligase
MQSVVLLKKEIRREMRQSRDSLSMHDINSKSSAIQAKLWQLIVGAVSPCLPFESIMSYIAFGSEVRTQSCIVRAINDGRTVIVPVCGVDTSPLPRPCLLPSRLLDLQSEVEEGRFGIPEPKPEFRRPFPPEKIDLVVVPGLGFDERGHRIGYGGGYYDCFLARCPQALLVGLAYEMQILKRIFPSARDFPVHKIITEDRVISCHNLRGTKP